MTENRKPIFDRLLKKKFSKNSAKVIFGADRVNRLFKIDFKLEEISYICEDIFS